MVKQVDRSNIYTALSTHRYVRNTIYIIIKN